jgi:hypothetical protein
MGLDRRGQYMSSDVIAWNGSVPGVVSGQYCFIGLHSTDDGQFEPDSWTPMDVSPLRLDRYVGFKASTTSRGLDSFY